MKQHIVSLISACLVALTAPAHGAPMVELFTSQGCYSCPPADKYLAALIRDKPEVVALSFHVDYWDDLNYGAAGVWKDPFSDAAYSKRQRSYNRRELNGKRGVYTPQMVINGATAQIGSSRRAVSKALDISLPPLSLSARQRGTDVVIDIEGESAATALVWLAVFDRLQVTDVKRGENHGKTLRNHHVVRELIPVADWRDGGGRAQVSVPALTDDNKSCAVFVQSQNSGPILGAAYCDS